MKNRRITLALSVVTLGLITAFTIWFRNGASRQTGSTPEAKPTVAASRSHEGPVEPARPASATVSQPALAPVEVPAAGEAAAVVAQAPVDFGSWASEPVPEPDFAKIEAFEEWTTQWNAASPVERKAMVAGGRVLAAARRPEFKALIQSDPKQALERTVPRVVRQDLPEEIVAELEKPVSATGDLVVYKGRPAPGMEVPEEGLTLRYFEAEGTSYKARVFGELEPLMTSKEIPLHGVAIERELAVAESPVRPLEVGERIPAGTVVEDVCPVSGETTEAVASGEPVTEETPTIEVGERIITLCNGSHVTVMDDKYRVLVQAAGSGSSFFMDAHPGTSSGAIGNLRCLYIRATYPDQMAAPNTEDQALADMQDNARFYLENSYGKLTSTYTVTPLITLPQTLKWYQDKDLEVNGLGVLHSQAREEARKLGYDSNQYNCIILRVNGGLRAGSSWGGGDSVWLGWGGMDVINHEIGHSLGVGHANYWATTDGTPYGNGSNQEYGNPFDVMGGGGGFSAHYRTPVKRNLGWLPAAHVHFPKTNGIYRIHAFDQPRLEEGKRYAFNVAKNGSIAYDIEYHASNPTLASQALVLYGGRLIDTTPGSPADKSDGGIQLGRTYSDPESDQHFTLLSVNPTEPPSIDLAYHRGPFPGNVAPTASLDASTTTVAVGGTVTFTATANDANGDPLAYHWQFSDGFPGGTGAVSSRSFNSSAHVTALLTVSDMKGGIVRRSVTVTVGTPATRTISGTITDGVSPLAGVLVKEASNYTYSNSDGTYTLVNVANGSRTLSATLAGYSFTPSFTNPMTVSSNVTGANWTASGSTFVTLAKTADASEGGANGNFRFTRTGNTSAALTVSVASISGSAGKTTDYTLSPDVSSNTFTIPAGSATLDVAVAAVNDTAQEGPETITLQMVSGAGYWSGSANSVVMTVNDNDTTLPQVAVTAPDPNAFEASDHGIFTFTRTGSTTASLNLSVEWSGSATNGGDYQTLATTVTIPAGQASVNVPVTVLDDSEAETPEDVIATINAGATYIRDSSASIATVSLSDDDTPYVSVSVADKNASEAGPDAGVILIHRSGPITAPLKVYYGLSGSASHGTDYRQLKGEVIIPAGATTAPVVISPYDDGIGEGPETVTLALATYNNAYSLGASFQGTVTIADNADIPVISVRNGTVGTEGGSNASVIFRSVGSATGNVTVNYTVSGTATAGSDYTALSGSVTVPASGPSDVTVPIPLINDALAEPTETVVVTISPGASYQILNDGKATAIIRDNDSGADRVAVSAFHTVATESGTTGKFYFSRPGTTGNLTVNYALSGTATNGTDYATLPGTCVIPDGASGVEVIVTPINDTLGEGSETVVATVTPGGGYSVDLASSATVEISDNDATVVSVGFQTLSSATGELPDANGQFRDYAVVLSAAAANSVSVICTGGAGASASGDDIDWVFVDPENGNAVIAAPTLVFPPGTTSKNVRIRVKNDGFAEPTETIVLELRSASGASLTANKHKHTVWLSDGASPAFATEERWSGGTVYTNQTWSGSAPYYTGFLPGFTAQQNVADSYSRRVTGQIVAPATGTYKFWIASDDASRLYLSTTSSAANKVQIASVSNYTGFRDWDSNPSQTSGNISLVAGQSYYLEAQHQEGGGGDHLSVAWEGPGFSRTPIAFDAPDTAPRQVRLAVAASSVTEADGTDPLLMVMLDRPAGDTAVTVDFTVGGTATAGSDYTLTPGTLTFAAGEQVKPLPLSIIADSIGEMPEAIVITLANPSGAQITSPSTHVITVRDEDAPAVTTLFATATSEMSPGTVIGTVSATPTPGRSISGWTILAGNTGSAFAINAAGQVSLSTPGALPNPGGMQLVIRATDDVGTTGDGVVNIICNAANGVIEQRWSGRSAYDNDAWTTTPAYSGTLATFITPQDVDDNYSRRLTGYLKPAVSGDYTFWVAGDDDCRLYLSSDGSPSNKTQIARVSNYTGYLAWDSQPAQKSSVIPLVAGKVYRMEAHQVEGGGGDHLSVAWQGPGIVRQTIPSSATFSHAGGGDFGDPPVPPTLVVTSPGNGVEFIPGQNVTITAAIAGGSIPVTAVEFYRGTTLIGSDNSAPYSVVWANVETGSHLLTAKAVYPGGGVTSTGVPVSVADGDPDGDGLTTADELAAGTNPNKADSDGDGYSDGIELSHGGDPLDPQDLPDLLAVAHWDFDDNTVATTSHDRIGVVPGTLAGGAVLGAPGSGRSGQSGDRALDLGTTTNLQRLDVANPAFLRKAGQNNKLTISFWQKLHTNGAFMSPLWAVSPTSRDNQRGIQAHTPWTNGTVYFDCGSDDPGHRISNVPTGVTWTNWNHIALVRDGGIASIWINGNLLVSGTNMAALVTDFTMLHIGSGRNGDFSIRGKLDDFAVFREPLTGGQIAALAAGANPQALLENRAPVFVSGAFIEPDATEDTAYSATLTGSATDVDAGDSLTYSKVSGPAWLSVAANGMLSGTPVNANVGQNNFIVRVTDTAGLSDDSALLINVINTNDAPAADDVALAVVENANLGTAVGTVPASDPDVGDTRGFAITAGNSAGRFAIHPTTGRITAAGAIDFETTSSYVLTVTVTDAGGLTDESTVSITVTNVVDDDSDGDAVSDDWEVAHFGNLAQTSGGDTDADGLDNAAELAAGSNPNAADSDGDGKADLFEVLAGSDPASSASLPAGLYAGLNSWWRFDESSGASASDVTGGFTGPVSGATWSTGVANNALSFDGVNDGVLPGTAAALIGSGDFAISAWVKIDPSSPTGTLIQQREPGSTGYIGEYMVNVNANGRVNFFVYGSGGYQFDLTTTATVNNSQWRHITAVREGTSGKIYIDGVLAASGTGTIQALQSRAVSIGYDYRDNNKRFKGLIDEVRIYNRALSASEAGQLGGSALPLPWQGQDIGSTGVTGSHSQRAGGFSVVGSGATIGGPADAFRYVWQNLTGDGSITVRVASLSAANGQAKAGIMIRESLTAGSRHALVAVTPSSGAVFVSRTSTSGGSTSETATGAAPRWLRLTRSGHILRAWQSADGATWTRVGSDVSLSMAANIYIGLATGSNDNAATATGTFDNVIVTP